MCYHKLYLFLGCGHSVLYPKPITAALPCQARKRSLTYDSSLSQAISASLVHTCKPSKDEVEIVGSNMTQKYFDSAVVARDTTTRSSGTIKPSTYTLGQVKNVQRNECEDYAVMESNRDVKWRCHSKTHGTTICGTKEAHPLHTFRVNALCNYCESLRQQRIASFEVRMITESVERNLFKCLPEMEKPEINVEHRKRRTIILDVPENKRRKRIEGHLSQSEDGAKQIRGVIPLRTGASTVHEHQYHGSAEHGADSNIVR